MGKFAGNGRRRNSLFSLYTFLICITTAMHQLCKHITSALMNSICQFLQLRNEFFIRQQCAMIRIIAFLIPLHICKDNQADAAFCSSFVELHNRVCDFAFYGMANAHRRHNNPVLDLQLVDCKRLI